MTGPDLVALIGPRAAGKSTVGRLLAEALGWSFVDADEALAAAAGMPAGELLRRLGEPEFRTREQQVSLPLLERTDTVVALGGGAVLSPLLAASLARPSCLPVLLLAAADVLVERLRQGGSARPPLTALPLDQEVAYLLAERLPRYRSLARLECDTAAQSAQDVAQRLARLVRSARGQA